MNPAIIASPDIKITYDERRVQALRAAVDLLGADARPAALIELADWIVSGPAIVQPNGPISQAEVQQLRDQLGHAQL